MQILTYCAIFTPGLIQDVLILRMVEYQNNSDSCISCSCIFFFLAAIFLKPYMYIYNLFAQKYSMNLRMKYWIF